MVQNNDPQEANENQNKATPAQQRKQDALELAELIYNIYNKSCPVISLDEKQKGGSDV